MCGTLLAGTTESPGEAFFHDGMRLKIHRGLASVDVLTGHKEPKYKKGTTDGVTQADVTGCAIVDRGPVASLLPYLLEGVQRDLKRLGVGSVWQLHDDLYNSNIRFHVRNHRGHA